MGSASTKILYDRESLLGEGSFAHVCRGTYENQNVAVKVIRTEFLEDKSVTAELDTFLLCDTQPHENILKCLAVSKQPDMILIALELCQYNLKQWIKSEYPLIDDLDVAVQITAGIKCLHFRGLLHCDLKPQNILFKVETTEPKSVVVKIADFGLSKIIPWGRSGKSTTSACGTIGWMAPELIQQLMEQEQHACENGSTVTSKMQVNQTYASDIFSLGCILYYLHTGGKHPFGNDTYTRQKNIMENNPSLSPKDFEKSVLDWKDVDFIKSMLDSSPQNRPTIGDVHNFYWRIQTNRKRIAEEWAQLDLEMAVDIPQITEDDHASVLPVVSVVVPTVDHVVEVPSQSRFEQMRNSRTLRIILISSQIFNITYWSWYYANNRQNSSNSVG